MNHYRTGFIAASTYVAVTALSPMLAAPAIATAIGAVSLYERFIANGKKQGSLTFDALIGVAAGLFPFGEVLSLVGTALSYLSTLPYISTAVAYATEALAPYMFAAYLNTPTWAMTALSYLQAALPVAGVAVIGTRAVEYANSLVKRASSMVFGMNISPIGYSAALIKGGFSATAHYSSECCGCFAQEPSQDAQYNEVQKGPNTSSSSLSTNEKSLVAESQIKDGNTLTPS